MKTVNYVWMCGVLMLFCLGGYAQPHSGEARPAEPPQRMTPEQIATRKTEHLNRELGLTEKQFKKVYKIYLKQAQTLQGEMESRFAERMESGRPPMGGPGGPGGGMRPGPGGPDMRGERPEGMPRGMMPGISMEESEKDLAARDKKMKKILSEDQYAKWRKLESQMEERRMRGMNALPEEEKRPAASKDLK